MKTIKLLALGSVLALSSGLACAQQGWYTYGNIGDAHTNLDLSKTDNTATVTGKKNDKFAGQVGLGYRMDKNWSLEASYVNFGTPSYDILSSTAQPGTLKVKNQVAVLALQGYAPVSPATTLTAKVGVAEVHTKTDLEGGVGDTFEATKDHTTGTVGIGTIYKVNRHWDMRANVDWYPQLSKATDNSVETKAYLFSVGAQYNF